MRMRAYSAPCRMGAYAPVWGEGARTGPSWSEFAPKDWKPAQIPNHASIMRPMRMRPTRIRHPQRMAEIRMALLSIREFRGAEQALVLCVSWVVKDDSTRVRVQRHLCKNVKRLPTLAIKDSKRRQVRADVHRVDRPVDVHHLLGQQVRGS